MAGRNIPPGHQEVIDVFRVKAAKGDGKGHTPVVMLRLIEVSAGGAVVKEAGRIVIVDAPPAEGHAVFEKGLAADVVLGEHVIADQSAVLPFAGDVADPS